MPKITLIGAGSVVFAKRLIGDVLQFPELANATICLMDIDAARLRVAQEMARRMIARLGAPARLECTLDRTEAIRGADYVICTIQVGGYKPGTVIDFEIPKKYGLRQTIADTLGVGGVFRALRTIPELVKIAEDIERYGNRECLLLNYTNPMAMNCWAVDRAVGIPHVGLCHSVQGTSQELARYCGIPYNELRYKVAGINHMAFFLEFSYRGQDAYPLLFKAMEDPSIFRQNKVRFEMMRRLGYFVTESSEHQSEYVPYFIHHGDEVIEKFDIPLDEYIRRCESIISSWQSTEQKLLGEDGEIDIEPQSHEYGAYIIHACETGNPTVIYGNVPNRGLITNLPHGCCVELPCLVDANRVQPTFIGDLPPQLAAICRTNINVQELTVEAALTGRRDHIYHAVMSDPHTAATLTLDKIWAMCDDLIAAHQKEGLLGEFKPTIPNTGRPLAGAGDTPILTLSCPGGFNDAQGVTNEILIHAWNPRTAPVRLQLTPKTSNPAVVPVDDQPIEVDIPAASETQVRFSILNKEQASDGVKIDLLGDACGAFLLGAMLQPRPRYTENGAIETRLGGEVASRTQIRFEPDGLALHMEVNDSLLTEPSLTGHHTDLSGSYITLRFNNLKESAEPQPIIVAPSPSGKAHIVKFFGGPMAVHGASATVQPQSASYAVHIKLPYESIGLTREDNALLFNLSVNLCALGDAHSGGLSQLAPDNQFSILTRA